jgi:hypothetical protein
LHALACKLLLIGSNRYRSILAHNVVRKVLDSMVLVHSSEVLVGMDRSKDRDRSSSLLKKEQMQPS